MRNGLPLLQTTNSIINQRFTSCHQVEKFAANNPSPVSNGSVRIRRAESCLLLNVLSEKTGMKNSPTRTMTAKRIAVAVAAVCATMSAPSFAAGGDMKALMDLLLKKGVITQQEYDQNIQAAQDAAENQAFKEKRLSDDVTKLNKAAEKSAKSGFVKGNGFGLESTDGQHSINLTGRVHFDSRINQNDFKVVNDVNNASLANNFEVRRARIGFNGVVFKDINYEVITNAVGSNANLIDTAFINYGFNKAAQVRVGRFKQAFGLEELTSSNNIDFMERSYANQLTPGKRLGIMLHGEPIANMTYAASIFQNGFNELTNENTKGREASGRVTYNFAEAASLKDSVLHLGLAGTTGRLQVNATSSTNTSSAASDVTRASYVAFNSENRGLSNIYRAQVGGKLLSTPAYGGVSDSAVTVDKQMTGLESAFAYGPYKFQGEYVKATFDAVTSLSTGTADVAAGYAEVMYNVTGEKWSDSYKAGAFGGIKPNSNFTSNGGSGAWQVGLRYSMFDVTDVVQTGTNKRVQNSPKANTTTVGINWLLNPNARVMLNYARTKFNTAVTPLDVTGATSGFDENVISLRTQINF